MVEEAVRTESVSHTVHTEHVAFALIRIAVNRARNEVLCSQHRFQPRRCHFVLPYATYRTHLNQNRSESAFISASKRIERKRCSRRGRIPFLTDFLNRCSIRCESASRKETERWNRYSSELRDGVCVKLKMMLIPECVSIACWIEAGGTEKSGRDEREIWERKND